MQTIMPPINTEDGLFHEGNPTQGTQGTIVTALFLNNTQGATRDTQKELTAILTEAGMLPDGTKTNQVITAIKKLISDIPDAPVKSVNNKTGAIIIGASDLGAYPATGGYINGSATIIGNLAAQNGSILIHDKNGVRLFELSAKLDGSVTFTSLLTGKGFSIDNNGHLTTYIGSQLLESGQRVYSPNNPPPSQSSFTDVSGNWISKNNRSGMIMQGGIINRSGDTTSVTFPVAFPGTCSAVFITQIAQAGASSENIVVSSRSLTGCTLVMRSNETAASWMAIGA
ncbi:gp53-like domain-containing protein [Serratia sp. IR-2025]